MRRLAIASVLTALATPVAAQTVTVEGGGSGLGAAAGSIAVASAGGGYLGANVQVPGATWLMPYLDVNGFADVGVNGQAGIGFQLARAEWIARPVVRIGAVFAEEGAATVGFGVYVGRRAGGLFTADVGSTRGVAFAVIHFGGYYGFGGER